MNEATDKASLIASMDAGWTQFNAYLDMLTDEQKTVPTDAAGWTVKDHVAHLAVWEGSMIAVIDHEPQWTAMGLDQNTWATIDEGYDTINQAIRVQHQDKSWDEIMNDFRAVHQALSTKVAALSDADLQRPFSDYQPDLEGKPYPLIGYVSGNSWDHYDEHQAYIARIVSAAPTTA